MSRMQCGTAVENHRPRSKRARYLAQIPALGPLGSVHSTCAKRVKTLGGRDTTVGASCAARLQFTEPMLRLTLCCYYCAQARCHSCIVQGVPRANLFEQHSQTEHACLPLTRCSADYFGEATLSRPRDTLKQRTFNDPGCLVHLSSQKWSAWVTLGAPGRESIH